MRLSTDNKRWVFTIIRAGDIIQSVAKTQEEAMILGTIHPCWVGMSLSDSVVIVGTKIFLVAWIIFVPIVITARLDKIIKLLQDKK